MAQDVKPLHPVVQHLLAALRAGTTEALVSTLQDVQQLPDGHRVAIAEQALAVAAQLAAINARSVAGQMLYFAVGGAVGPQAPRIQAAAERAWQKLVASHASQRVVVTAARAA